MILQHWRDVDGPVRDLTETLCRLKTEGYYELSEKEAQRVTQESLKKIGSKILK